MNGKGSTPRPVNRKKYERNYDAIRWRQGLKPNKKSEISVDGKRGI
jgi:hypothetical protein